MSWVWENSKAEGVDRLVLLAVADSANDMGMDAYPSVTTLVRKTGVSERTVQRSLKRLASIGELHIASNAGRNGVNVYRVLMVSPRHPVTVTPRQNDTSISDHKGTDTPVNLTPRQSDTPVTESATPVTVTPEPSLPIHKKTSSSTRGHRLPADWRPTIDDIGWQRSKAMTDEFAKLETEKFRNHFESSPGQRGVKLDWSKAWRNWLLNALDRGGYRPKVEARPGVPESMR
jgi:hypothetical protein